MSDYRYRVFLVDDEIISIQLLSNIIRMYCPEMEVVGTAQSAAKCLEKMKNCVPDILISDIRMPGVNGIDLIARVREIHPDIVNVVISGYREFEYAKAAMMLNAEDYLLKPITPADFRRAASGIEKKVDMLIQRKRIAILSGKQKTTLTEMERYFPHKSYYAAVIRKNGLPKRFISQRREEEGQDNRNIVFDGRDVMETFYLIPAELVSNEDIAGMMRDTYKRETQNACYTTMVLTKKAFQTGQIVEVLQRLYHYLDYNLVVGSNQILFLEEKSSRVTSNEKNFRQILSKFTKFLEENRLEEVQEELFRVGEYLSACCITQKELEKLISVILVNMEQNVKGFSWDEQSDACLEEVLFSAGSIREVFAEITGFLKKAAGDTSLNKLDSPEFIEGVVAYVCSHLTDDISMKKVSRIFNISQTYLGQLFHKYKKMSFSNCVIELRIARAKELLREDNGILIKDVARLVGYQDQFYFSRIFRSITGMTPTDFLMKGSMEND